MDKKVLLLLTVTALVLGCALLVNGQGFYPDQNIGGYPNHHHGGGGGGGWGGGGGGGWGGGRNCQCRRYCYRGERYSGPCRRRPWRRFGGGGGGGGGGWGRRRVLCCPMYRQWH